LAARGDKVIDLDPVMFTKEPGIFPDNYIRVIQLYLTHPMYDDYKILVSTHRKLLDALSKKGIHHLVVGPEKGLDKHEWFNRYTSRGDTKEFISLIDSNWELFTQDMLEHCEQDNMYAEYIGLGVNQYLKDVI
jgi:hypothetical protein